MDLTTKYMGFNLKNPLVVSASPLSESIDNIKMMEDHSASAVVLYSLFEEQLEQEEKALFYHTHEGTESYAEATSFYPDYNEYRTGPEGYLNLIRKAKENVDIPIIGSLNGYSDGGWTQYAQEIEQAGANGLELNIYYIPTDLDMTGQEVELEYVRIVKNIIKTVKIPVAVKLSPFFSNLANLAQRLDKVGANAMVLFNRFYQPDIDLEALEVKPNIILSKSHDVRLPLRWIALLKGRIKADLAATSGIHSGWDVLKLLMSGANVTMLNSLLLKKGISQIGVVKRTMEQWMEDHEYESVQQMIGSMSYQNAPDPVRFERVQYVKALSTYQWK